MIEDTSTPEPTAPKPRNRRKHRRAKPPTLWQLWRALLARRRTAKEESN